MLKFKNQKVALSLVVEGYEQPHLNDYWDANWLNVRLRIHHASGTTFDKVDPCLQTTDLPALHRWFEQLLQAPTEQVRTIDFMEPCLAFRFAHGRLDILLQYELNPHYQHNPHSVYSLSFDINHKEIARILRALQDYIRQFPVRE